MSMPTFASYDDVCVRVGNESLDEDQVDALIASASAILLRLMGDTYNTGDEVQAANLATVCCAMVARAVSATANAAGFGVTQHSMTASSFNEQFTYTNPSGDLYLTALEKKLLGIGAARVFTLEPDIRRGGGPQC